MFSPSIAETFNVDQALASKVRALLQENAELGFEVDQLRREVVMWQSRAAEASAQAEKVKIRCRLAESENAALRQYING